MIISCFSEFRLTRKYNFTIMRVGSLLILLILLSGLSIQAQDIWSLQKCIQHAKQNNLSVKQSEIAIKQAQLTEAQAKASRWPSLNAGSSYGYSFGRTIDPVTNDFSTQSIGFNSFSINTGVTLFNGGRINNTIKQSQADAAAAQATMDFTANNLVLSVASAYLQILLAEEQLDITRRRITQSQEQLDRTEKLIRAGALAQAAVLDIEAQLARDQQDQVAARNNVELTYLNLKQLLQLEPDFDLRVEKPEVLIPADASPDAFVLKPIYIQALGTQTQIRAAELRRESAAIGVDIAKASRLPSLSIGGGVNTNYSTLALRQTGTQIVTNTQEVKVNGVPVEIETSYEAPIIGKNPYFNQLGENLGQNIGLNLQIPIYNNRQVALAIERANLNILQQDIALEQEKQQLKSDIQTAIANARAARQQLEATNKTYDAAKAAFDNADRRFQLGAINAFELTTARNNLNIAETNQVISRYDYLFKLKIIDFYQGKQIDLE